jgi:hypothetical protein
MFVAALVDLITRLWDGTTTLSTLLGSFSWLVPRRIIKEITELEKLHVVRRTKNYQSSLSNYSPVSSFLGFQIMATTSHMYLVGF